MEVHGPETGDLLVLGWGSTYGSIVGAVNRLQEDGRSVARIHLRHVWPLPKGLDEIFSRYKAVLVPEMNLGQMTRVLRSEYPHQNFISYPKVQGQPFRTHEIIDRVQSLLEQ
jgi:2-oxoglutarate ferredoxin oxidoreductase subunit alpha